MGKKYIIELLDDCPSEFKGIIVFGLTPEGQIAAEPIPVEDLTPYTEPDMEQVRKEAYDKGYDDATAEIGSDEQAIAEKAYKKGLSDAWDAARKVTQVREYGGYGDCLEEVFGRHRVPWDVFDYSASEVIKKIRAYEQEKEEQIQVGDEVISPNGKGVVTEITDIYVRIMYAKGSGQVVKPEDLTKTGRHFAEIAEVFAKMKESDNG